jgi:hypothetical protein
VDYSVAGIAEVDREKRKKREREKAGNMRSREKGKR